MATRYETTSVYEQGQAAEEWHLMRRLFLLLLLVLALSLGLVLLSRRGATVPPVLFNILVDGSLGLMAGIGTRLALSRPPWFVKALVSAAASVLGLGLVGLLTNWKAGIGPIQAGLVQEHWLDFAHISLLLPLQFAQGALSLSDIAHVAIAVDTSWIALRAWPRGPRTTGQTRTPAPRQVNRLRPAAEQRTPSAGNHGVARVRVPSRPSVRTQVRPRTSRGTAGRSLISKVKAIRPKGAGAKRWTPNRRRASVQLAVYEEHRCPYCLQEVSRNDPRGTVECPVCHTLHHKECWDITGTCQVPHLNN